MFCPKCGAGDQRADAYCKRCGVWLVDPDAPPRRRRGPRSPEEKLRVISVFSLVNAALALFSAIALYSAHLGRGESHWSVPVAGAFCLVIAAHQIVSFVFNTQLRRRLRQGREDVAQAQRQVQAAAENPRLNAADPSQFLGAASVTEGTTELLEPVPRRGRQTGGLR